MSRFPLRPEPTGLEFTELKEPPNWDEVFGSTGPLELEIGSGYGGFALGYVQRHPEVRYVAFEWRKKFARETMARAREQGSTNLRVVEADARPLVPRLFKPGSLSAIHFQFPDPWWKRAHFKRAVLQPDFTRLLLELAAPGALFDLRTDVEDRGVQMLATLEEAGWVNPLGRGVFHPYDPEDVPSTRERRYLVTGQPVYRARLRKPV
jgi:tRNA (guanine-N7-)-methyltransferase